MNKEYTQKYLNELNVIINKLEGNLNLYERNKFTPLMKKLIYIFPTALMFICYGIFSLFGIKLFNIYLMIISCGVVNILTKVLELKLKKEINGMKYELIKACELKETYEKEMKSETKEKCNNITDSKKDSMYDYNFYYDDMISELDKAYSIGYNGKTKRKVL